MNLLDRETWSKKLGAFKLGNASIMALALELSPDALLHFNIHGDVIRLNEFLEAIPENFGRRAAFVKWAADHAPLGMKEGKFVKDKKKAEALGWDKEDGKVKAELFEKSKLKSFWDYVPAPKPVILSADDAVQNVYSLIARMRKNDEKHTPTAGALDVANRLETAMLDIKKQVAIDEAARLVAEKKAAEAAAA